MGVNRSNIPFNTWEQIVVEEKDLIFQFPDLFLVTVSNIRILIFKNIIQADISSLILYWKYCNSTESRWDVTGTLQSPQMTAATTEIKRQLLYFLKRLFYADRHVVTTLWGHRDYFFNHVSQIEYILRKIHELNIFSHLFYFVKTTTMISPIAFEIQIIH